MSDTSVAPLPPSYDWGFVVGRSISAMADTIEDPDRLPEARGSNGRVTFTPHTRYKKELSAPTAFVQFEVITARIENGNVVDAQGENGLYLISGAYKVAFTIDSGSIPGFDILVKPEHTLENPLDLVTASPFVPEVGTPVTTAIIPAGAAEDQVIAWRNGRLVWVNGSVQAEAAAARAEAAATAAEEWKPEFTWSDTTLVIDGVPGPNLKGKQGDGSSWDALTGKPETYPSTIPEVEGLQAALPRIDTTVGTRVLVGDVMIYGETGKQDITKHLASGLSPDNVGRVLIFRRGTRVVIEFADVLLAPGAGTITWARILDPGWRPHQGSTFLSVARRNAVNRLQAFTVQTSALFWTSEMAVSSTIASTITRPPEALRGQIEYDADGWPASLPGIPA